MGRIKTKFYDVFGEGEWMIAFRRIETDSSNILSSNIGRFKVINQPKNKWAADPIIRYINGERYLFAELYDNTEKKGSIAVSKYSEKENKFEKFCSVISEPFHMSFPEIFEYNDKIYMIPETNEVSQLRVYVMKESPYDWELEHTIDTEYKLADTVVVKIDNVLYLINTEDNADNPYLSKLHMFILKGMDDETEQPMLMEIPLKNKEGFSYTDRNGGSVIGYNGKLVRVVQKGDKDIYGKEIGFRYINAISNMGFEESEDIISINPRKIQYERSVRYDARGIHTYGRCMDMETIDIRVQRITLSSVKKGMSIIKSKIMKNGKSK